MNQSGNINANQLLRVARINPNSRVLGPGARAVIWFHGCSRNCPGCIAHSMNSSREFHFFLPSDLASEVLKDPSIHGITISGGEPFEQDISALREFMAIVHSAQKSIICYTGLKYETILTDPEKRTLLDMIDLLIDGEYQEENNNGSPLRGSDNQRFIFLSDRFAEEKDMMLNQCREIECDIGLNNTLEITGIPERGFLQKIEKELNARGLEVLW